MNRTQAEPLREGDLPNRVIETVGCRQDGSTFPMELGRGEMQHGDRTFTLVSVRDISERKAHTEALEHLALHDGLTGLANRTLFGNLVSRALQSAKRSNDPLAVLVMDLDGFKLVNDTLGHDRGDSLLRQVAERLTVALREGDTVARLGGDEFGILPGEASDLSAAAAVALKIQQTCAQEFVINDETVHVSPSIGIALFPEHGASTANLLHRADLAMYAAKRSGDGHAVFNATQETQTADRLGLLVDLRRCVTREELILEYQPKFDLATGDVYGVEALVRWLHPTQGLLPPASFMGEVERTHLIAPVTRWVLNAALRQQRMWRDEGLDLTMAVNVSPRSLRQSSSLPDTVAELTRLWDTTPGGLILELTESALIGEAAPAVLTRLHVMGQMLSIDDFGTGYSSLAYLQRLPVDEIKVDESFVTNLAAVDDDAIIVRSTIELAHNLGLTVVAEGVAEQSALDLLVEYGCDGAQGFYLGRPATSEKLAELLMSSSTPTAAGAAKRMDRATRAGVRDVQDESLAHVGPVSPVFSRERRRSHARIGHNRPCELTSSRHIHQGARLWRGFRALRRPRRWPRSSTRTWRRSIASPKSSGGVDDRPLADGGFHAFWISSDSAPMTPGPCFSVDARATSVLAVADSDAGAATARAGVASTASAPPTMARLETAVPSSTRRTRAAPATPTV